MQQLNGSPQVAGHVLMPLAWEFQLAVLTLEMQVETSQKAVASGMWKSSQG